MCVVSVTVFEIMKFDSHETILCCQKNKNHDRNFEIFAFTMCTTDLSLSRDDIYCFLLH